MTKLLQDTPTHIKRKMGLLYAAMSYRPPKVLPKTDYQKVKELKELMLKSGGKQVAQKVIDIALNDEHPGQMAALKMCMDRTLPVSMFEKDKAQRGAVTINITGIGATTMVEDITDIEPKDERT